MLCEAAIAGQSECPTSQTLRQYITQWATVAFFGITHLGLGLIAMPAAVLWQIC